MIFIGIAALLFAVSLYFKDSRIKENKTWLPYILGVFRFFTVLGILFLLLMPLLKRFIAEKQKPVVVILQDKSASIQASTEAFTLEALSTKMVSLENNLSEKYDVVELSFGENLAVTPTDSINTASTNISSPLEYISETFEDQNLGAIILTSDGIFNEGKNPLYADMQLAVPIYSVPLGDTVIRTDILIKNVLHNRIVYLNDKFQIEVDIQAYNAKGTKNRLTLYKEIDGKRSKIKSENFTIDKNSFFKSVQIELEANQVGNVKYVATVDKLINEISSANNSRNIYLEVLDARQKILLLANATHPDIKAYKRIIKGNKNYELDVIMAGDNTGNIRQYDIVMLHDLPSAKHKIPLVLEEIKKQRKPVFFINGASTDATTFNSSQDVLTFKGGNQSLNDITPILKDNFDLFTLDEALSAELNKYVPLKVQFGEYKAQATAKVLMYQKIGNVDTQYPLLAYSNINNHKQAVLAGEGLWRWRLFEYQEFGDYENSKTLITKTLQYISQKEDKRQFRAFVSRNAFKENESITFDAQLYNQNYEPINNPEAEVTIKNSEGEVFKYSFSKSNNYYFVDAGRFPEGNYTFTAKTNYSSKDLTASGKFSVESILKEQYDLTARHDILHDLSSKFGGSVIYPDNLSNLAAVLNNNDKIKPILYQKSETTPVLDHWWLLGLLVVFLAVEWFLRRYFGGY